MIKKEKDFIDMAVEKYGADRELAASIYPVVIKKLRECLENPDEIAYRLPKFGTFRLKPNNFRRAYLVVLGLSEGPSEEAETMRRKLPAYELMMKKLLEQDEVKYKKRAIRYGYKPTY